MRSQDYRRHRYFITLCTLGRAPHFGSRVQGLVRLNALGDAVDAAWKKIAVIHPTVALDAYVVMPEHLHGIVDLGMQGDSKPLGMILNQFKGAVSKIAARQCGIAAGTLWQRDFYERHMPMDAMDDVRRYIDGHRVPRTRGGGA